MHEPHASEKEKKEERHPKKDIGPIIKGIFIIQLFTLVNLSIMPLYHNQKAL